MSDVAWLAQLIPDDIPLWAGLPAAGRADFLAALEPLSLAGGQELFAEGEPADALYILVSGLVGISALDGSGRQRHLARVSPPETIGEMALISDAGRSATAVALRDSVLLRLSRASFEALVERWPRSMLYLTRLMADRLRLQSQAHPPETPSTTVALLPVTSGVSVEGLADRLAAELRGRGKLSTLVLGSWPQDADEGWFHRVEAGHDRVLYASSAAETDWGKLCLRRADHVLFVAAPDQPLLGGAFPTSKSASDWRRRDLVLVQPVAAAEPGPAHPSLDRIEVDLRLNLRGDGSDLARLARMITGRACGVVFSGGGARGFAHIGVARALVEAGYDIDLAGGTSIGAIVAACIASGWPMDEVTRKIRAAFATNPPLNDYTIPVIALLRGRKVDAQLAKAFGGRVIEELWLPFFCVSSNLTTALAKVHRRGHLAKALRASIAIPGLLPPVVEPDGVLADGAMMNNLPADIMAELKRGPVVAVDVSRDFALQPVPRPSLIRSLLGIDNATPTLGSILLRSATVSSDAQLEHARSHAAVVLQPPLASIGLRSWASFDEAVDIGYRYTRKYLEDHPIEPASAR